jgi:hypothetical protein
MSAIDTIPANLPAPVAKLLTLAGQIVTLTTSREVKYRKDAAGIPTLKVSKFQTRIGVNYDHIGAVKTAREEGVLPAENAGLNGMEWVAFPHLLRGIKSGKHQIRCTRFDGNPTVVTFLRNGVEISRDEALVGALASEMPKDREDGKNEVFNVTVESITHVNGVPV